MNELLNGKQEISEKDITNIKLLLYQISLFTNERAAFSKWCTFCKRFNYEDNPIINEEAKIENPMSIRSIKNKLINKSMKFQAIHQLLLCNNSQMRKIISFSESIYQSDDAYQKHVMEYSKQVTNTQGEKLFSLESKYLK